MSAETPSRSIILASSSRYRKLLLERLGLPFEVAVPDVDETALAGEAPADTALRLAAAKAAAVAARFPAAVVIGSDQVAVAAGRMLGKPGTAANARQQLTACSGQRVEFLTAVSLQCAASGLDYRRLVPTVAVFRPLSAAEIERYVARDQPLDCAGSIRTEAAGIGLLSALESSDPTAVVGLPLIAVAEGLREAGVPVP